MGKSLYLSAGTSITQADALTRYYSPVGPLHSSATENQAEHEVREAGVASKMRVYISANAVTGTSTATLRKNAADAAVTFTIGSSATGNFEDTSNTVTFADGDKLCIKLVTASVTGTPTLTINQWGLQFDPTDTAVTISPMRSSGLGSAYFFINNGTAASLSAHGLAFEKSGVEALRVPMACTWRGLALRATLNFQTVSTTVASRIGAAAGNQSLTITGGATGYMEDVSNTDTLSAGDEIIWRITSTVNWGIECVYFDSVLETSTGAFMLASHDNERSGFPTGAYYQPVGGEVYAGESTEANAQFKAWFDCTVDETAIWVHTGFSSAETLYWTLRKNSADTSNVIDVAQSTSGWFTDATSVSVTANDLLCFHKSTGTFTGLQIAGWTILASTSGTTTVYGTAAASSGFTGTATATKKVYGVLAASSGATGTIAATVEHSATLAASSGFTATAAGARKVSATAVASSGSTATITATLTHPSAALGASGFTATAAATKKVYATLAGSSGFTATASATKKVYVALVCTSGFTALATGTVDGVTFGTAAASSGFTGSASATVKHTATLAVSSGFTGTVVGTKKVYGVLAVSSGFTAEMLESALARISPYWQYATSIAAAHTQGVSTELASTSYIWLAVCVNSGWTRADYWYSTDGVTWERAGAQTSGLPDGTQAISVGVGINKSAGTTAKNLSVDLVGHRYDVAR